VNEVEFVRKKIKTFRKEFETKKRKIRIERRDCGASGSFGGGWFYEWGLSIQTGHKGLKGTILIKWLVFTIRIDRKQNEGALL